MRRRQTAYRVLPPQEVFEPAVRSACSQLFTNAENVGVGRGSEA